MPMRSAADEADVIIPINGGGRWQFRRWDALAASSAVALMLGLAVSPAQASLLFAVGGGGGAGYNDGDTGGDGQFTSAGQAGFGMYGGAAGTAGSGGQGGTSPGGYNGGGGAGYLGGGSDGAAIDIDPGAGAGGSSGPTYSGGAGASGGMPPPDGGFGGGGGGGYEGGGGGGGYSGGGGGGDVQGTGAAGGGGGSHVDASVSSYVITLGANGTDDSDGMAGSNGYVTVNGMTFSYTGSVVDYTIGTSGLYDFTVAGAEGGGNFSDSGGYGAIATGSIFLTSGSELELVIGGAGLTGDIPGAYGGGGGGGTFVSLISGGGMSTVPLPASAPMFGAALVALGAAGYAARRKKTTAAS